MSFGYLGFWFTGAPVPHTFRASLVHLGRHYHLLRTSKSGFPGILRNPTNSRGRTPTIFGAPLSRDSQEFPGIPRIPESHLSRTPPIFSAPLGFPGIPRNPTNSRVRCLSQPFYLWRTTALRFLRIPKEFVGIAMVRLRIPPWTSQKSDEVPIPMQLFGKTPSFVINVAEPPPNPPQHFAISTIALGEFSRNG